MSERWPGKYIVTEGTDATGKTTVANLLAEKAYEAGNHVIRVDEPDSAYRFTPGLANPERAPLAPVAAEIRKVIKNGALGRSALANIHLFTASRAENWHSIVRPALNKGYWVIGARNWLSTQAYQGYAEGYDVATIEAITSASLGSEYMNPDHLFILDLDDEAERARRIAQRGPLDTPDTFESRPNEFQQRIIEGYRTIARAQALELTSAAESKDRVAEGIWRSITR